MRNNSEEPADFFSVPFVFHYVRKCTDCRIEDNRWIPLFAIGNDKILWFSFFFLFILRKVQQFIVQLCQTGKLISIFELQTKTNAKKKPSPKIKEEKYRIFVILLMMLISHTTYRYRYRRPNAILPRIIKYHKYAVRIVLMAYRSYSNFIKFQVHLQKAWHGWGMRKGVWISRSNNE